MTESLRSFMIELISYPLQDSFYHHIHLWQTGLSKLCLLSGVSLCLLPLSWHSLWQMTSPILSADLSIPLSFESALWASLYLSPTTVALLFSTILLLNKIDYLPDSVFTGATQVWGGFDVWQSSGESGLRCVLSLEKIILFRASSWSLGKDLELLVQISDL